MLAQLGFLTEQSKQTWDGKRAEETHRNNALIPNIHKYINEAVKAWVDLFHLSHLKINKTDVEASKVKGDCYIKTTVVQPWRSEVQVSVTLADLLKQLLVKWVGFPSENSWNRHTSFTPIIQDVRTTALRFLTWTKGLDEALSKRKLNLNK